jgi:ABC-type glycerol-3-phosphate transport system substrate-binding protein
MNVSKKFASGAVLIAALVFSGCGEKTEDQQKQSNAGLAAQSSGAIHGEISVSCYDSMNYRNFLEQAAKAFEEQYPGTTVKVDTFSAMPEVERSEQGNIQRMIVRNQNDPQSRSDYISRVNTGLMSGNGADIFAMDILPLYKFVQSGTLENLDPYINSDITFNKTEYRKNILDAVKYHNGTWFLPIDYTFNYYAYDATLLPDVSLFGVGKSYTAEELFKIGASSFMGTYKLFNTIDYVRGPGGMFNQLLHQYLSSFVDLETRKPNFLDSRFTNLLKSVKQYGEQGYIPRGVTGQQNAADMMRQTTMNETERYFFKENSNVLLVQQFSRSSGRRMVMRTSGNAGSVEDDDEIAGIEALADGGIPFKFNQGFGINEQSKNKATAWAFLKFLLSEEMQLSTALSFSGLPLHNKARDQKAELVFSGAFMGRSIALDENQKQSLENYKMTVEALSDQINRYVVEDTIINDMIAAEVQYFFNGSRSAEEVANVLQNKVELYLNE